MAEGLVAPAVEGRLSLRREGFALDAAFAMPRRGIVGLFGPSGAGKSTLLRCLAGLEPEAHGHLRVNGATWQDERTFLAPHRRSVGLVFQDARLFPHMTVRANLGYGARRLPPGRPGPAEDDVIELLGLGPLLERRPAGLSGGEAQRVAIGRALLAAPDLLLLDEPLASLDARRKDEILPFLERLHGELAMPAVFVSHSVAEIRRLADTVAIMAAGRIVAHAPTAEALAGHGGDGRIAILAGRVTGVEGGALAVALAGGPTLRLAGAAAACAPCRVRIAARDVTIALDAPGRGSALATLPSHVTAIGGGAIAEVALEASGQTLYAEVDRAALDALGLAPGATVHALVLRASLEPSAEGDAP